jgi:hypothetical protein
LADTRTQHTKRPRGRGLASAAAATLLWCSAAAWGDPAGVPLAPVGACAEPRGEVHAAPDQVAPPQDLFEVGGTPLRHFAPTEVAASGPDGEAPPVPPGFTRGACDAPNASCGLDNVRKGRLQEGPATPDPLPGQP